MNHTVELILNKLAKAPKRSNPSSVILRMLLEKRATRKFFGSQLIALSVVSSVFALPIHAFDYTSARPQYVNGAEFVPVTTETTYMLPAVRSLGISQGFGRFHPGVDLRAPRGSEVVAIADGVVIEANYSASGYGKHVRTLHDGDVISLSAHMDTLLVKGGEKVNKGQQIGTIGMTGRTTGPHLHLEVSQKMKYIDPLTILR